MSTSAGPSAGLQGAEREPPWGDAGWLDRTAERSRGEADGPFVRRPLLAPRLLDWWQSRG